MFRRPQYIALIAVLLLVLATLSLPRRAATQLKLALSGFFLPLLGLASSAHGLQEKASRSLLPRSVLLHQIEQLHQENERLRLDLSQASQLREENENLRQALAWQRQSPWNLKLARVILREPSNWWRMLHIDRGYRDGVTQDMPVLTAEGLVGKIYHVGFNNSQVLLVGDPLFGVAALVTPSRDQGIITAGNPNVLDPSVVSMTHLDGQSRINLGDQVFTSGVVGIFPTGILIGQIIETNAVGFGLNLQAKVKLAANLRSLEHVWILFP